MTCSVHVITCMTQKYQYSCTYYNMYRKKIEFNLYNIYLYTKHTNSTSSELVGALPETSEPNSGQQTLERI